MAAASPAAPPHLRLSEAEKNLVEALAGAFGAVTGTWVFYPLDTLKTRLQARPARADVARRRRRRRRAAARAQAR